MKYLVIGAGGLLGEAFMRLLGEDCGSEVEGLVRADVDLVNAEELGSILREREFDVLLNCAGLTGLEACLDDPKLAHAVNVEAPRVMAEVCREAGARFVHFSTDYVFSGEESGELDEACEVSPVNEYGMSKLRGERAVLEVFPEALVARVSWIFGRGRRQFVDQVLRDAFVDGVEYIGDKWSVPNYADDLVEMSLECLEKRMSGVVHLVSHGGGVSWHEYAVEVLAAASELGKLDEGYELPRVSTMNEISAFRAKRPVNTVMSSRRELVNNLDWRDGLRRYLNTDMVYFGEGSRQGNR